MSRKPPMPRAQGLGVRHDGRRVRPDVRPAAYSGCRVLRAQGLASGTMGGTYGAGPLAAAAACATLDVIRDEDLLGNAERRGRQLVAVRAPPTHLPAAEHLLAQSHARSHHTHHTCQKQGYIVKASAACATLDAIRDEDLLGNAERRGRQLVTVRAPCTPVGCTVEHAHEDILVTVWVTYMFPMFCLAQCLQVTVGEA